MPALDQRTARPTQPPRPGTITAPPVRRIARALFGPVLLTVVTCVLLYADEVLSHLRPGGPYLTGVRRQRRDDIREAVNETFAQVTGSKAWSAVYETPDGEQYAIWAHSQAPNVTAQHFADGVHGVSCGGCKQCHLAG